MISIKDVKEAIQQGLPQQSRTVIHPNLGAAHAFLARVYLQMANYGSIEIRGYGFGTE